MELPVEIVVVLLFGILAQEGRSDGDSVETITCQFLVGIALGEVFDSGKVAEGWHQVVEGKLGIIYAARLDMLRPPGDERDADAALVALALQALQLAVATEELWIGAALLVRTVIRGKDHHGILVETLFLQLGEDFAYILVETGNHSGKLGVGMNHGVVSGTFLSAPGLVLEELLLIVLQDGILRLGQFGMRQGIGEEAYERMLAVLTVNPLQCLVVDDAGRILVALEIVLAEHRILDVLLHDVSYHRRISQSLAVAVEEVRIIKVGLELADVAVEFIYATLVGSRGRTFVSACPLAEDSGAITFVLQHLRKNLMLRVVRFLTHNRKVLVYSILHHWHVSPVFLVASYVGMTGMLTRHDGST